MVPCGTRLLHGGSGVLLADLAEITRCLGIQNEHLELSSSLLAGSRRVLAGRIPGTLSGSSRTLSRAEDPRRLRPPGPIRRPGRGVSPRRKLLLFETGSALIGFGAFSRVIPGRPEFAIGMLVVRAFRGHGNDSAIIRHRADHRRARGWRPICGCDVSNRGSRRCLENAGFIARYRLLEFSFQPHFPKGGGPWLLKGGFPHLSSYVV